MWELGDMYEDSWLDASYEDRFESTSYGESSWDAADVFEDDIDEDDIDEY